AVSFDTTARSRGEQYSYQQGHQPQQPAQNIISSLALQTPRRSSRISYNTPAPVTSPTESHTSTRSSVSSSKPQENSVKRGRGQTRTAIHSTRADSRRARTSAAANGIPHKTRSSTNKHWAGTGNKMQVEVEAEATMSDDSGKGSNCSKASSDGDDANNVSALERRVTRLLTLQNAPIASRLRNRAQG
ncbi:hypothetical protein HDU84_009357, partial [Entophlyctis sp. JEL0112]